MSDTSLPIAGEIADEARHGSYCPKLCTFACPVAVATGRDDAAPWSFHRVTSDLVEGRIELGQATDQLTACTGCLGCQTACVHGQDVPTQVRAARAHVGFSTPGGDAALATIAAGERFASVGDRGEVALDEVPGDGGIVIVVGCHDSAELVAAARALVAATGEVPRIVSEGCCGALADDLGAVALAQERRDILAGSLDDSRSGSTAICLDPHCMSSVRTTMPDADVLDLWTYLEAHVETLQWVGEPTTVTYHDPCILARTEGVVSAPRRILEAAGCSVLEPEFSGDRVACSGAGMAMPAVDPPASEATARRRREQLLTGASVVTTACARAGGRLDSDEVSVVDLAVLLASRLVENP